MARNNFVPDPNYRGKKNFRVPQYSNDIRSKTNMKGESLSDTQAAFRSGYLACARDEATQYKYLAARAVGYSPSEAGSISKKYQPKELKGVTSKREYYRGKKKLVRSSKSDDKQ